METAKQSSIYKSKWLQMLKGGTNYTMIRRAIFGKVHGHGVKVARYSFSGSIPLKFEHKLRRQKQSFGKIATTVVLDKDENLL